MQVENGHVSTGMRTHVRDSLFLGRNAAARQKGGEEDATKGNTR